MAKTYNARATIDNILNTAARLFVENGFERTSMQDIAETAGVSKGAIYHHFKSKEDIIQAVMEHQTRTNESLVEKWLADTASLTGKEQWIALLEKNIDAQETHALDELMSGRMKSAEFVLTYMQRCVNRDAAVIADLIRRGVEDGSIRTDYPDEAAEVFLLLLNVWCDPAVFSCDAGKLRRRLTFLQHMMKSLDMDVLHDELLEKTMNMLEKLYSMEQPADE